MSVTYPLCHETGQLVDIALAVPRFASANQCKPVHVQTREHASNMVEFQRQRQQNVVTDLTEHKREGDL